MIRGAAALLLAAAAGCDPPPPDRPTYVTTWVDAIETVVREEATTGDPGIDPLAAPTPQHHARLAGALVQARAAAGISEAAWEAAVLTHEAVARDEIRRRAAALVQGWAEVSTQPADNVAAVLLQSLTGSFASGWNPPAELVAAFAQAATDLSGEAGESGRWLTFLDLLTSEDPQARVKVEESRTAFEAAFQRAVREMLAALPPGELTRALSDRRLSDGMWEYAVAQWNTLPPVPEQLDGISLELREAVRDRVNRQRELALHLSGWAFAATEEGRAAYVARTRTTVRTAVVGQLLPLVADAPLRPLPAGDEMVQRVLEDVATTLATDAEGDDIRFRMLHLRHGEATKADVAADVRAQIGAARAAVQRPIADLIALARAAAGLVPAEVTERFERRDWALQEGVAKAAAAKAIPEAEYDYLRLRLQSDPRPRDAFDAALEGR
ncbi:MAG: hypothetical protein ACYTGX_02465 [Planctomycetota bacterium]